MNKTKINKEEEKILVWVELELDKEIYEDLKKELPNEGILEGLLTKLAQDAFRERLQKLGKDKLIEVAKQVNKAIDCINEE